MAKNVEKVIILLFLIVWYNEIAAKSIRLYFDYFIK